MAPKRFAKNKQRSQKTLTKKARKETNEEEKSDNDDGSIWLAAYDLIAEPVDYTEMLETLLLDIEKEKEIEKSLDPDTIKSRHIANLKLLAGSHQVELDALRAKKEELETAEVVRYQEELHKKNLARATYPYSVKEAVRKHQDFELKMGQFYNDILQSHREEITECLKCGLKPRYDELKRQFKSPFFDESKSAYQKMKIIQKAINRFPQYAYNEHRDEIWEFLPVDKLTIKLVVLHESKDEDDEDYISCEINENDIMSNWGQESRGLVYEIVKSKGVVSKEFPRNPKDYPVVLLFV